MAKRGTSGSSIVFNNEIHFKGEKTEVRSSGKSCAPVDRSEIVEPVNINAFVAKLLGSLPSCAGSHSAIPGGAQILGGLATASMIEVTQNPQTAALMLNYALSLLKVVDGAYAKNGVLTEEELRNLIAYLLSGMLEKAGPAYSSYQQVLKDAMCAETLQAFLKGVQPVVCAFTGDPVNANTGNFVYEKADLEIKGKIPLIFSRFYNRLDTRCGSLGKGWRHNYEIELRISEDRYTIIWEDGREEPFLRGADGTPEPLFDTVCRLKRMEDGFCYEKSNGRNYRFDANGRLLEIKDANGTGLRFTYNRAGCLATVYSGRGAYLSYRYSKFAEHYLEQITDHTGRSVCLAYELGSLRDVTNAAGEKYHYDYDENGGIWRIRNPRAVYVLENTYDKQGRISGQKFADGGRILYDYQEELSRTFVIDQNGGRTAYVHDDRFRNVKTVYIDGEETFQYDDRNQMVSKTDKNGNQTRYAYDDRGNTTQIIFPDGSKHNMTYDTDNHLLTLSINGRRKMKNVYDKKGNLISTADALGRIRKLEYDEQGNAISAVLPDDSRILFQYDERGNITSITDAAGNQTRYTYDACNRATGTIDGNGNNTRFVYDACDRITEVINAEGKKRTYAYTKNGKIAKVTDFNGAVTQRTYNEMNRVTDVLLPDGGKVSLEYDLMQNVTGQILPNGAEIRYRYDELNRLEAETLPTGGSIRYEYDRNGNRTAMTDPNGNRTVYMYDESDRVISVTDPVGATTEYDYDMEGNLIRITNALGQSHTYTYDEAGQRISETDIIGNTNQYSYSELGKITCAMDSAGRKTVYSYEKGGLLAKVIYPDGSLERYRYDGSRNLIRRENQRGDYLEFTYDCLNRMSGVKSSFGQETIYTYDAVGNVTSITDALGHKTVYTYSLGGKLISVTDADGNKTEYTYDGMGNLTAVNQGGGHITRYERNLLGKIETVIDPLGLKEYYLYDDAGQMVQKTDREGYETRYQYTPAGNLEQISYGDGRSVTYSYNALRQLTAVRDWLGMTEIELDEAGRTRRITDHKGRQISYRFGRFGERKALIYPDGRKVTYEYDELFRLSHLVDGDREIRYGYDEAGRLEEKVFSDGLVSSYEYNEMGLLSGLTHTKNGKNLEQYQYRYDLLGNKTEIRRKRAVVAGAETNLPDVRSKLEKGQGTYGYRYDRQNRLTEVRRNRDCIRKYRYDAFGNRIWSRQENGEEQNFEYNAANQLIARIGGGKTEYYRYDQRGNLTEVLSGTQVISRYQYDAANRLSEVLNADGQSARYQYNGLGNRTSRQEYVGENPSKEADYLLDLTKQYHNLLERTERRPGNGGEEEALTTQRYVWDSNVAFMTEGESAHIYLQDELGSTVRLIGVQENSQIAYGYDEFGNDIFGNQGEVQPFGYTGYQKDSVANTYFAQAREYLPGVGRFGGEDWIKGKPTVPDTWNAYIYCAGSPIDWVDLDGKRRRRSGPSADEIVEYYIGQIVASADRAYRQTVENVFSWFDDTVDVTVEFGTGVGAKGSIYSVDVGGVAKNYIEIDENFETTFKSEAGISAGKKDLFELKAGVVTDDYTAEGTKVKVGIDAVEWDGSLKITFGGEVYAGIGGGGYVTVDLVKVGEAFYGFGKALLGCDSQR